MSNTTENKCCIECYGGSEIDCDDTQCFCHTTTDWEKAIKEKYFVTNLITGTPAGAEKDLIADIQSLLTHRDTALWEAIEEFAKLAHSVKCRIEQQKTPNEEGANKALQILIDTHHQELQKTRTAEQERVVGIVDKLICIP